MHVQIPSSRQLPRGWFPVSFSLPVMIRMPVHHRPHRTRGITGNLQNFLSLNPIQSSCYTGVETALQASEMFSRIALLRLTPQLLDAEVDHNPVPRMNGRGRLSERTWTMNGTGNGSRRIIQDDVFLGEHLTVEYMGWRTCRCGGSTGQNPDHHCSSPPGAGSGISAMCRNTAGLLSAITGDCSRRSRRNALSLWKTGDITGHSAGNVRSNLR